MSQYKYIPPSPPIYFTILWCSIFGSIVGFLTARGNMQFAIITTLLGAFLFSLLACFSVCEMGSAWNHKVKQLPKQRSFFMVNK